MTAGSFRRRSVGSMALALLLGGVIGCDQGGANDSPAFPTPSGTNAPAESKTAKAGKAPVSNAAQDSARGGTPPK